MSETHRALGGRFVELAGSRAVADYGDPVTEYRMVRERGGVIDRNYRRMLQVSGPDREALMQAMTTNDVVKQAPDSAIVNAICTGHGKVQSLFLSVKLADHLLLDMDPVVGDFTHKFLEKYTLIRDAATCDVSGEWGRAGVYGPLAAETVAAALQMPAAGLAEALTAAAGGVLHGPGGALVVVTGEYGLPGFELFVPAADFARRWGDLLAAGEPRRVGPFGFTTLETLRIEAGRPRYGMEVDDSVILLEAGLTDAVSFEKGCFVGQETLSRVVFRGQLNRRLCGLLVGGAVPESGDEVRDGDAVVGVVKSVCYSPGRDAVLALAYLKRSHWEPGSAVTIHDAPAQTADLPFGAPPG
ncbi:MAG: hypothetical protein OEW11_01445 [Nitrospirota bacterium]|nr:hypothetical protein [Nitrospirota bacterium]